MEKFVGLLPLHLIAVLISAERDEATLKYLLSGLRLLHSLFDLVPGHAKLEQVLCFMNCHFTLQSLLSSVVYEDSIL